MRIRTKLIACGIFGAEFRALDPELRDRFDPVFFDSMLHMRPAELDRRVAQELPVLGGSTVIAYGDCSPHMREFASRPRCARTAGINCCEICLGSPRFRELRRGGSFFLMPEWTERWEEVFKVELGFSDRELARTFMRESSKELVFLDTGVAPPPLEPLAAASEYLGLPVRRETTGLSHLAAALRAALKAAAGG